MRDDVVTKLCLREMMDNSGITVNLPFWESIAEFTLSVGFCTSFSNHMILFSSNFLAPLNVGELIGTVVYHFGTGTPHQFTN
jgi:hypothetical protein